MVVDTTTRILGDLCDLQSINNASDDGWKEPLWRALEDAGLPLAWVPEDLGGVGVDVTTGFDVLQISGRFAVPVPLAETMLAGWLLAKAGVDVPSGTMTVALGADEDAVRVDADGSVSGQAQRVPFASDAHHLAVPVAGNGAISVALVAGGDCRISAGRSIAGDSRDDVSIESVQPVAIGSLPVSFGHQEIALMGAAVRARQMAGALAAILDMAVEYAKEREAFGRPIAKFQAIQHSLARLGGEVAAAEAASGSAADAIALAETFDDAVFLEAAAAKIRVGEAAGEGAAIAHQVFGAIGFTEEHVLQRLTRRLWAWRDDFGSESHWAVALGRAVAANGADELWPALAAR